MVTPQWLRDCVSQKKILPCEEYAALQELRTETAKNCPDCNLAPCACSGLETEAEGPSKPVPTAQAVLQNSSQSQRSSPDAHFIESAVIATQAVPPSDAERSRKSTLRVEVPPNLLPPDPPIPTRLDKLDHASRYACQRASPLICPNQEIVREFEIIYRSRAMDGEERSALSYERAISVIKGP